MNDKPTLADATTAPQKTDYSQMSLYDIAAMGIQAPPLTNHIQDNKTAADAANGQKENSQGFGGDAVDAFQKGAFDAAAGAAETVNLVTGSETAGKFRDAANNRSKDQIDQMSQAGQEAMNKQFFSEDEYGRTQFGEAWTDPRAFGLQVSALAGQMVPQVVGGLGIGSLGAKVGGNIIFKSAAKQAAARGLAAEEAAIYAKGVTSAAFGTGGQAIAEAGIAGGMMGVQAREEVLGMSNRDQDESNEFRKIYLALSQQNPNESVDNLRKMSAKTLADRVARAVETDPALVTSNLVLGAVGGRFIDNMLRGVGTGSRLTNAAQQAVVQGGTEGVQGGLEQNTLNRAMIDEGADSDRNPMQGVISSALNEGIMGGALGGAMGGIQKGAPREMLPEGQQPIDAVQADENGRVMEPLKQGPSINPQSSVDPAPSMSLDDAVSQIKAERGQYKGIDDDIRIAEQQGFTDEAVRLRAAKRNYEVAADLIAEGDIASAERFRERGNKIYRDVMEVTDPQYKGGFPAEYVAVGEMVERAGQFPAPVQPQGETVDGQATRVVPPTPALQHSTKGIPASVDAPYYMPVTPEEQAQREAAELKRSTSRQMTDDAFTEQQGAQPPVRQPLPVVEELPGELQEIELGDTQPPLVDVEETDLAPPIDVEEIDLIPYQKPAMPVASDTDMQVDTYDQDGYISFQPSSRGTYDPTVPPATDAEMEQDLQRLEQAAKPVKQSESPTSIRAENGRKGRVKIGDKYELVTFQLVDLAKNPQLAPTMQQDENQPRDRKRFSSNQQINKIAKELDFNELGESPRMSGGAPTITNDGKIIGGNGRTDAVRQAYANGTAENYRNELKARAREFGLTPAQIDAMEQPVLVRRLQNPVDVVKAAIQSNDSGTMNMSPLEQARADSKLFGRTPAIELDDNGAINWNSPNNQPALKGFIAAIPQNEQNSMLDGRGFATPEAKNRFARMLMYRAFGNSRVLSNLIEDTSESSRNLLAALESVSPRIAVINQQMAEGTLHRIDISDYIVEAVELLESLRISGRSVSDYINQLDMVSVTSPATNAIAAQLEENIRSRNALLNQLNGYYDAIVAAGHPDQGNLFGATVPALEEITGANRYARPEASQSEGARRPGLGVERTPAPEEAQTGADSGFTGAEPQAAGADSGAEVDLLTPTSNLMQKENEYTNGVGVDFSNAEVKAALDRRISVAKSEIINDVNSGTIDPSKVAGWQDLDDFVDSNSYITDAEREGDRVVGPLGKKQGWKYNEYIDFTSRLTTDIDKWIKTGALNRETKAKPPEEIPKLPPKKQTETPANAGVSVSGLPEILTTPRKAYLKKMASAQGVKRNSPGYDAAMAKIEENYESAIDEAQASLTFEQFNKLNSETPESLNRQAWESLREEYGIDSADVVRNTVGNPFKTVQAARAALKKNPGYEVSPTDGGFELTRIPEGSAVARNGNMAKPTKSSATDINDDFGPDLNDEIEAAASEAATSPLNDTPEPTESQMEAGNYKKGHVNINGLDISIENPRGSIRSGIDNDGESWSVKMAHHYGYIKKTEGADGEHIDVYIGRNPESQKVFIVDQVNPDGSFDEHKVMVGFKTKGQATSGYRANYTKGWKVGPITEMSMDEFKEWIESGDTNKPLFATGVKQNNVSYGLAKNQGNPYEPEASNIQGGSVRANNKVAPAQIGLFDQPDIPVKDQLAQAKDNFAVRYRFSEVGTIPSGIDSIKSFADAAHVVAAIRKHGQETLLAVVTGENGKVLEVIRHTKGAKDASAVYVGELAASIAMVDGAQGVWFAHNHPSGITTPSDSDHGITVKISKSLDGSGITPLGHVIVAPNNKNFSAIAMNGDWVERNYSGEIVAHPRSKKIALKEKTLSKVGLNDRVAVTSPNTALQVVEKVSSENALLLFDTQNRPVGSITITDEEMSSLRENGTARRVLSGIGETNAAAVIIKTGDIKAARNISSFLNNVGDIRILDYFYKKDDDGKWYSDADRGGSVTSTSGTFASLRKDRSERGGAAVKNVKEWLNDSIKDMPSVEVVETATGLPVRIQMDLGEFINEAEGAYDVSTGKSYIIADKIKDQYHAKRVFLHEVVGHGGVINYLKQNEKNGGKAYLEMLDDIYYRAGNARVNKEISRYSFDYDNPDERRTAVLEYIAHLAEQGRSMGLVRRVIAALRDFIRKLNPDIEWTDTDTLALIERGRQHLRKYGHNGKGAINDKPLASVGKKQTETAAFKKWFGDKGIVDDEGNPAVFYHSGNSDFEKIVSNKGDFGGIFILPEKSANYRDKDFPLYVKGDIASTEDIREFVNGLDDGGRSIIEGALPYSDSLSDENIETILGAVFDEGWSSNSYLEAINQTDEAEAYKTMQRLRGIIAKDAGFNGVDIHDEFDGKSILITNPNSIKSATDNNGSFDPENPSILMRVSDVLDRDTQESPIRSKVGDLFDALRYQVQDKLIDLKREQENIENLDDSANAYQKAAIWEGKAGERLNDFDEQRVQPLLEKVAETKLSLEEVGEWLVARHAEEANAYLAEINPDKPDDERFRLSGMSNEDAASILASRKDNAALQEIGTMVDSINSDRVDMLIKEGLIEKDMADAWRSRYKNYVPLNREEAETGDYLPSRGQGFQIKGKESKQRTGSAYWKPGKILSHVIANYESSIVRAEKNKVGEALLKFVEENPNDDFWQIDTERRMKVVRNGKVVEGAKMFSAPNELTVKRNGVEHVIVFNPNNQRAARLAKGMKNLQASEMNTVMRGLASFTRFLATINTSFNPEFMVSNFFRDVQTAAYNLSNTELQDMKAKVIKDIFPAMNGIRSALFGDGSAEWSDVWEDFRLNGGKTGWLDLHSDIKSKENDLKKMIERVRDGKAPKAAWRKVFDGIENMNNVVENAVRLSAYKHSIDAGLSKEKAAALAKDLTVNFNRKGAMGPQLNAFYMFFNAAVQGNVRLLQAMVNSKKGQALAVGTVGFAVMLDIMNRSMAGDDDDGENLYDALPDYVKDRNIIIMGEKEPIIKIPAPWGYNTLHVIGQEIGKAMSSGRFDALESASRIGTSFVDAFNPLSSGSISQMLSPTISDPIVQIAENKNFAGNPLMPEHTFDAFRPSPEYQMHFSTARQGSKELTEFLNDITGGNEVRPGAINISPEVIDLLVDTFTGGAGRTVANTGDFVARLATGKELETENIPFLRKVTGFNNDYGIKGRYYEWSKGVGYSKDEAKKLTGEELIEAKKRPEYKLVGIFNQTERELRGLRKRRRALEKNGADDKQLEQMDEQIRRAMARFNKQYVRVMFN